jgi:hypothetical protein
MAGHACHSVAVRASLTVLGNNVALHSMALQSGFSFAGGRENKNKNCVIVKNMSVSSCCLGRGCHCGSGWMQFEIKKTIYIYSGSSCMNTENFIPKK